MVRSKNGLITYFDLSVGATCYPAFTAIILDPARNTRGTIFKFPNTSRIIRVLQLEGSSVSCTLAHHPKFLRNLFPANAAELSYVSASLILSWICPSDLIHHPHLRYHQQRSQASLGAGSQPQPRYSLEATRDPSIDPRL